MPKPGGTAARGYGGEHKKKRAAWKPTVDAGKAYCHADICLVELDGLTRWIQPGTPWDLGHTVDRSRHTGPEHRRCNRSAGGKLRGRVPAEPRRWVL